MKTLPIIKSLKQYSLALFIMGMATFITGCASSSEDGVASNRECRGVESLGSKIRRSVCMTKEQWAVVDEEEAERKALAQERSDDFLRGALQQSTQVQGRGFDTPGPQ